MIVCLQMRGLVSMCVRFYCPVKVKKFIRKNAHNLYCVCVPYWKLIINLNTCIRWSIVTAGRASAMGGGTLHSFLSYLKNLFLSISISFIFFVVLFINKNWRQNTKKTVCALWAIQSDAAISLFSTICWVWVYYYFFFWYTYYESMCMATLIVSCVVVDFLYWRGYSIACVSLYGIDMCWWCCFLCYFFSFNRACEYIPTECVFECECFIFVVFFLANHPILLRSQLSVEEYEWKKSWCAA